MQSIRGGEAGTLQMTRSAEATAALLTNFHPRKRKQAVLFVTRQHTTPKTPHFNPSEPPLGAWKP